MKKIFVAVLLAVTSLFAHATTHVPMTVASALLEGYVDEVMTQRLIESLIGPQKCFYHPLVVNGVRVMIYGSLASEGEIPQCVQVARTIKSAPTYTYQIHVDK